MSASPTWAPAWSGGCARSALPAKTPPKSRGLALGSVTPASCSATLMPGCRRLSRLCKVLQGCGARGTRW
eukprot:11154993-Lingulodinium_polyedra.AAC.1